jgi:ABC-2 type transport system ATP-binding protein
MMHRPKVLILDEPTNGLDPAGIVEVRQLLNELALNHGVTVFVSSHILGEVARLTTRIGIVHQGRLLQETDVKELQHILHRHLLVQTRNSKAAQLKLQQSGYKPKLSEDGLLLEEEYAIANPDEIARLLVQADMPPVRLAVQEEDLETYFLRTIEAKGGTTA